MLAGEGWHPGVIGIVAARIAERHYRPTVLIALEGDEGSGSGRSIPGFDLLAGLEAGADELLRHGGHRAAAGLTIARNRVERFREAFVAHAARTLTPADLIATERVDAVAPGDTLRLELAEELERLKPFGVRQPRRLAARARRAARRPAADGGGAPRRVLARRRRRPLALRAVRQGQLAARPPPASRSTPPCGWRPTATTAPPSRASILRCAQPAAPQPIEVIGEPVWLDGVHAELDRDLTAAVEVPTQTERSLRDKLGIGVAGLLGDLVATGEPVLVVAAHAPHRARALQSRVGGFAVTSWAALEDDPGLARAFPHVVALDPPAQPAPAAR